MPFVLEGQVKQNGNALIGAALIFTGDVEKDVVPTAVPVRRQALPYPLRPFGEQEKHHIAALAHDVPRLNPPRVGFFQEEIRGHADPDLLTTLDFVVSGAVFLERIGKSRFFLRSRLRSGPASGRENTCSSSGSPRCT